MTTNNEWTQPKDVQDIDLAFGGDVRVLMPNYADIPPEFKNGNTRFNRLFAEWFYSGTSTDKFTAKPGIDKQKALRHLAAFIGSWAPKHEHKEAAAAYLMSLWFV